MIHSIRRCADGGRVTGGWARKDRSALLGAFVIGIVAEAWLIHQMSCYGDFLQTGKAWKFTLSGVAAGSVYWIAADCFNGLRLTARQKACVFWLTAVVLRLLISPIMPGDDLWRYRWEGMIQLHGFNPYQASPESPILADLRDADWARINHRDYPAIYPPLTEAIFAGVAATGNTIWLYKALFAFADLAGIFVLRQLLIRSDLPAEQAAWYAWNPLVIYTSTGAAHFDGLMILALLGAILALDGCVGPPARLGKTSASCGISKSCWLSALLLGTSVAIKIAPLILLPVWMFASQSWRRALALLPVIFAPIGILALIYGFPRVPVFSTLKQFGSSFRVNDPFWWIVDAISWPHPSGNNILYGVCGVTTCTALAYWFRHDWRRGLLWVWGAALILSPVVHAWYVVWILPLAAWRGERARAWFVFSISIFGYFLLWEVNHASGKPWEEPIWLRSAILLPPLIYLAWTKLIGGVSRPVMRRTETIELGPYTDEDAGK